MPEDRPAPSGVQPFIEALDDTIRELQARSAGQQTVWARLRRLVTGRSAVEAAGVALFGALRGLLVALMSKAPPCAETPVPCDAEETIPVDEAFDAPASRSANGFRGDNLAPDFFGPAFFDAESCDLWALHFPDAVAGETCDAVAPRTDTGADATMAAWRGETQATGTTRDGPRFDLDARPFATGGPGAPHAPTRAGAAVLGDPSGCAADQADAVDCFAAIERATVEGLHGSATPEPNDPATAGSPVAALGPSARPPLLAANRVRATRLARPRRRRWREMPGPDIPPPAFSAQAGPDGRTTSISLHYRINTMRWGWKRSQ